MQRATSPRGVLEFAAHPGTYEVELLVITNTDGALSVEEARVGVTIESCTPVPPVPPKPDPKPPGDGKLDPVGALGRIRFGNAGCTATVIGPRRPSPTGWPSTERMGVTSAAVPVKNASSAM